MGTGWVCWESMSLSKLEYQSWSQEQLRDSTVGTSLEGIIVVLSQATVAQQPEASTTSGNSS
jgi:hypothetical protein